MKNEHTGFRREGKQVHEWRHWVAANRELINEIALPSDVFVTRHEFEYLLQHGYNRAGWWNEQPWFELSQEKVWQDRFWALLEAYVDAFYTPDNRQRELETLARLFRPARGAN